MIGRVSQQFITYDFIHNSTQREADLQKVQNQLSSGLRVNLPSQDPVSAVNHMEYDSRLKEISVYSKVIEAMEAKLDTIDSSLNSATGLLQRLRELAVQMGNGVYNDEERRNAAVEVDQLARELMAIANSYYKDRPLFGGTTIDGMPFKAQYATDPKTGVEFMEDVRYTGNHQTQIIEIERGQRVNIAPAGNQLFWADEMVIYPTTPVSGYVAPNDSNIIVDGVNIGIKRGDSLDVIANKINQSGAPVRAGIFTQNNESYFTLQSTSPHQITLMDTGGGTVLQDLGLIDSGMYPPYNYSPSARVYTGSVFDVMVNFRKALLDNDVEKIGGTALGQIDMAMSNMLKYRASVGSVSERVHSVLERFTSDEVYLSDAKQKAVGVDISRAAMEMKLMEFSHDVALSVGARLMPKTLLDFLR